jgi:hypothetical protein
MCVFDTPLISTLHPLYLTIHLPRISQSNNETISHSYVRAQFSQPLLPRIHIHGNNNKKGVGALGHLDVFGFQSIL